MEHHNEWLSCRSSALNQQITVPAHLHHEPEQFRFDRCGQCGLILLNPRVPADSLGKYYRDHYLPYRGPDAWGRYAHLVATDLDRTDSKRLSLVQKHARLGSSSVCLDIGCGKPTFLEKTAAATNCRGIGIDFTDAGWKEESERFDRLDLRVGGIDSIAPGDEVDVITMWHYLEHDYRPRETLEQLLRASLPDTTLFIEVPNHASLTRRIHGPWWEGYHAPRHTAVYDPDTLAILLRNAGWNPVKVLKWGTLDAYSIHWMSRMERKGIDWSESMERRFVPFVAGKLLTYPLFALEKIFPLAVMTAIAQPAS